MEQIENVVIGAGQSGLVTAYHLAQHDRPCVVLDANTRIGDQWRRQWDSLRLYTPARYDGLPGLPFPGDPWAFPGKDEVADYLESYAAHHRLDVRLGVRVERVHRDADGSLVVGTDHGTYRAANVVVATGTFGRTPFVPEVADELDPGILQLHSSEYRRPGQVPSGPVLVVGASHSGCDIAYELAKTHPTTLVGRDCGQIPLPLESRRMRIAFRPITFAWQHVLTRRTPPGRKAMGHLRAHGGPMLRVQRGDLAARGVVRNTARVTGARGGLPLLDDDTVVEASTVIWATGFRQRFGWIDLPHAIGEDGWPREARGVVAEEPGLYFTGVCFQFAFASMLMLGADRDATHVVEHLLRRDATAPAAQGAAA